MRFWLHNQLAGLAICATRLFHSACQSILQSVFQNAGHHEQMSNTQTSSRSQTNVKLNFKIFPSQTTTCCAPQRNLYLKVYLMDCCDTEISTVLFISYRNDQLQLVVFLFEALRSFSTILRHNDLVSSSLCVSFMKNISLVFSLCWHFLGTHTHTYDFSHLIEMSRCLLWLIFQEERFHSDIFIPMWTIKMRNVFGNEDTLWHHHILRWVVKLWVV